MVLLDMLHYFWVSETFFWSSLEMTRKLKRKSQKTRYILNGASCPHRICIAVLETV